jgi:prepilin-type N-terminal cleavage/methylation domain-containing protein
MRIKKKKRGVTLIELIISMAILSIIIAPIGSMVITSAKINKSSENRQKGTYNGQRVLEQIKNIQATNQENLEQAIVTNFGMVSEGVDNEGWVYYDKDWILTTNRVDAKYKMKINLSDRSHSEAVVNNTYHTLIINNISSATYVDTNGTRENVGINNSELYLKVSEDDDDDRVLSIISGSISIDINDCFDLRIIFDGSISEDQFLKIIAENNVEKSFNLYIDKAENITANYSIFNSFGWINKVYNSSTREKYEEIKNSIQVDITVYDKDNLELAKVTGYKNL